MTTTTPNPTTEPTLVDLWPPATASHVERLAELLRERHAEQTITGGTRPGGLRLSTEDPIRRVKEALDPFWRSPIDPNVGARGHLMEDVFVVGMLDDARGAYGDHSYTLQVPITWGNGSRSAYDIVVDNGTERGLVVSLKSTTGTSAAKMKPSTANVRQEKRMLALDGRTAGTEFHVWMIHAGTLQARGPFVYTLEQDDIDAAHTELDGVLRAFDYFAGMDEPSRAREWNDPAYWSDTYGLESSSGAFHFPSLDASDAIEKRNRAYLRAKAAAGEAKRKLDEATALIREHVEEQIAAARANGDPNAKSVQAFGGDEVATYSLTSNGQMRVTTKPNTVDAAA